MAAGTLLSTAAQRRLRAGVQRWRGSWWQILQCAVGAALAWTLAQRLWDQPYPVFACVAVVIGLGVSTGQRLRRVAEIGAGVTGGVVIGTLLLHVLGRGAWQLSLIVLLAMAFARFVDNGVLLVNQTAVQAVFIAAMPPQPGGGYGRWLDAMTGAAVAILIAALLPNDPRRDVRARTAAYAGHLADILEDTAEAVRTHDEELAARTLEAARGTQQQLDAWTAAVTAGQEVAGLSPLRRGGREELQAHLRLAKGVDRATRNLRVAVRRVHTALDYGERLPESLGGVFEELAAAVRSFGVPAFEGEEQPPGVAALRELALRLSPRVLGAEDLSATVVVAQLRSAVVDLLEAHGVPAEETHRLLPR
ncbi:FUSC family protein [Kineococcus glutinatus]|uniref:Integral membrane bound transporter domain-containing protein n=1 Tax=Kineococcus glutinatus TaxID=1070872 RepID=A0ABP9H976_9ACTN